MKRFKIDPELRNKEAVTFYNNVTYMDFFERMKLLAISLFEWENLPPTMNERYLELTLFDFGISGIIFDDNLGLINLKCTKSNFINLYGEAVEYSVYADNGYQKTVKRDDIILVRNNFLERPTVQTLELYAQRLAKTQRTIDTNIEAQKTPILIKCDIDQKLTLKNVYEQYTGNTPVIFGSKDMELSKFEVLKTDAPFLVDKLSEYKKSIWNELYSFLGINNLEKEKNTQMIVDEVNINNQMIGLSAETMLLSRKQACKELNKIFNTNVDVKIRDFSEVLNIIENSDSETPPKKEVEENE